MNALFSSIAAVVSLALVNFSKAEVLEVPQLRLVIDESNRLQSMRVARHDLPVTPDAWVALVEQGKAPHEAQPIVEGNLGSGRTIYFPNTRTETVLTAVGRDDAILVHCRVKGGDGPPRGLLLKFTFPFDASGWSWHQDIQTTLPIDVTRTTENVVPLRAWADLPEWRDQPDLRTGYTNRNFCTVLSNSQAAFCLAVPIDRACSFRTAYEGSQRRLELVYDFALTADTQPPNEVEFEFLIYACDPRWGFRDALARYYRRYPELFRNYVAEPGQWMAFSRLSEIDNANEFGFGLQEGAPEPEYDDQLGVLSTTYFAHAGKGAFIPGYDPEKDPLPPYEAQLAAMNKAFAKTTGISTMYHDVGLFSPDGRYDIRKWVAYGHIIAQFNLDPQLPYGQWILKRALASLEEVQQKRNARLDGFYYDGLPTGMNYRAEHFRHASFPCLWDPQAKKPLLNNFFSSCQFARAAAELMRPRGRITMMNGALGASCFIAPWLDVLGSETGLRLPRAELNYIRSVTYQKPFLTLLKGNYHQKLLHAEIEQYMLQCLAYGIPPGFFDWPTSGLGPGSRYWDHPAYFERDRDLFRKYLPLCRSLAKAGWEPVTWAAADRPEIFVERFGPKADGVAWLSILNSTSKLVAATIRLEPPLLEGDRVVVREMLDGCEVPLKRLSPGAAVSLEIPANGVRLLQVGTARGLARWHLQQAGETIARGNLMRKLDADRPPLAVHWRLQGPTYTRNLDGGRPQLMLVGDGRKAAAATQWAMLFQEKPEKLTLRVRAAANGIAEGKDDAGIACRLARVTKSFSYYENRFFALPAGSYPPRDFEFPIDSSEALRAILVTPTLKAKGRLQLAKISLSSAGGKEFLVDPEFAQWYEPLVRPWRGGIEGFALAAEQMLAVQHENAPALASLPPLGDELAAEIRKAGQTNAARRFLRDWETARQHLKVGLGLQGK